jgi:hypothetical protein
MIWIGGMLGIFHLKTSLSNQNYCLYCPCVTLSKILHKLVPSFTSRDLKPIMGHTKAQAHDAMLILPANLVCLPWHFFS